MPSMSYLGATAEGKAEGAATWRDEEGLTPAIGEGLSAIAYALLEVADAIREQTAARQQ